MDLAIGTQITSDTILQEQVQPVQTFQTTSPNILDTDTQSTYFLHDPQQPLALPIKYPSEFKPMSSQQRVAIVNAALLIFFGNSSTVSSILQTVQQTQQKVSDFSNDTTINSNETPLISSGQ